MTREKLITRYFKWIIGESEEKQSHIWIDMFKYLGYEDEESWTDEQEKQFDEMLSEAEKLCDEYRNK